MLRPFLWATLAVATVFASGEFVVLHSPKNVEFGGNKQIDHSVLKDVFKALLGFTIKPGSWSGIRTNGPFDLPKAVVVVAIEGAEHLESQNGKVYPLDDSEVEEITWQAVSGILQGRGKDNVLVRMRMADGLDALGESALGTLVPNSVDESTLQSLKLDNDKDRKVLAEIKLLDAIARNVPSEISVNGKPNVYWLVVSGMRPLIETHCNDSPAVKEALVLLNDALRNVTKAFMTAYKDQVVITAFTNGTSNECNRGTSNLSRQRRAEPTADDSDKNVKAPENTPTTPVIDSVKNDEEGIEKNEDEEAKTRTITEGSSLEKSDESPTMTESYEGRSENTGTEANEPRESSTVKSSFELENTTRMNEQSNTDTENTNRPLKAEDLNLAKRYTGNYPAIFNIFLWFGVAFFFSLLAVCITIADMDPGRDSIIYRMTSTRMKKDN